MKKIFRASSCVVISAVMVACGGGGGGNSDTGGSTDNNAVTATACSNTTEFCVYSPSVAEGAALPLKFASTNTTGGLNVNPALEVKNVPAAAVYLSAVMDDETTPECAPGTGACVHAGLFDLPKTKVSFAEDENLSSIAGATFGGVIGYNSGTGLYEGIGYEGPFPPAGKSHTYKMTIYAHKTAWSSGYGVISGASTRTAQYSRPPVSRAEVLADHGPSGDNDIVDYKTITFTFVGR